MIRFIIYEYIIKGAKAANTKSKPKAKKTTSRRRKDESSDDDDDDDVSVDLDEFNSDFDDDEEENMEASPVTTKARAPTTNQRRGRRALADVSNDMSDEEFDA
jgi:hypothetical protein